MSSLDEKIGVFFSLTGRSDLEEAKSYIEMANGNLEQAVNIFMDGGGTGGGPGTAGTGNLTNGNNMPPGATTSNNRPGSGNSNNSNGNDGINDDNNSSGIPGYNPADFEDEVRAPIPQYEEQMVQNVRRVDPKAERARLEKEHKEMMQRMEFDGTTDIPQENRKKKGKEPLSANVLNTMFAGPKYSERGSFAETLQKAQKTKRYILVNIQSKDQFMSHQLNRDVWSNELVEEIVIGNFVFWQRDNISDQGRTFCSYYTVTAYPWVCFIDPRTNRMIKAWDAKKWGEPSVAAEFMSNFIDKYSLELKNDGVQGYGGGGISRDMNSDVPPLASNGSGAAANGSSSNSTEHLNQLNNVMNGSRNNNNNTAEPGLGPGPSLSKQSQGLNNNNHASSSSSSSAPGSGNPGNINVPTSTETKPGNVGSNMSSLSSGPDLATKTSITVTKNVPPLPDPPADGTPGVVKIMLRLLNGSRQQTKVLQTDTLDKIIKIAAHYCDLEVDDVDLSTQFPKRMLKQSGNLEKSVKELDIAGEMLTVCVIEK